MAKFSVALADDHVLLRNGLAGLIEDLDDYEVLFEANNGKDLISRLDPNRLPDIVLMDINMPELDGYETTLWLKEHHPDVRVLALSMYDTEPVIIRMLKCGAKGFILKDIEPVEFKAALDSLVRKGYYYSELVTGKLIHAVNGMDEPEKGKGLFQALTDRETEFLKLACTELTYKEIAEKMYLSARTIDGYRDELFRRLNLKTRVGLVMYAMRNGIVNLVMALLVGLGLLTPAFAGPGGGPGSGSGKGPGSGPGSGPGAGPGSGEPGWDKVKVEGGWISGGVDSSGEVHFFKGIPFAAPPVGALRWRAPQPAAPWSGVRACTQFGASPMQEKPTPIAMWTEEYMIPASPVSEDCLYLNVWTAARTPRERRPVLVYIYGGGFGTGGGNVPIYDGVAMARKGVVYLTINYRVGIFGFFSLPELTQESGHQASGNYGLMDQIAALKWVKANIAAFGGDPDNVTIAGQSAGSMSVNCLVASPVAKGLFGKAIAESGAFFNRDMPTLATAEAAGQKVEQRFGAASLAALRALPAADLLKSGQWSWWPVVDGYVLQKSVAEVFADKKSNPVALLTGWNEEEGIVLGPSKNAADLKKDEEQQFGADASVALQYYPADNDSVAAASERRMSRDMIFGRQNYAWAVTASGQGEKVFLYRFGRRPPTAAGGTLYGAFHTAEVPYAYGNLRFVHRPWEAVDYNLSDAISSYWANFARTGDPNGVGLARWEPFSRESGNIMMFGQPDGAGGQRAAAGVLPDKPALEWLYNRMIKN